MGGNLAIRKYGPELKEMEGERIKREKNTI